MESVCGFQPRVGCVYRTRLDSPPLALEHAPAIRRLTWSDLPYFPGPIVGRMCIPELSFLCFYDEVVWAGVRLELPLCPAHMVVGQVCQRRYALAV